MKKLYEKIITFCFIIFISATLLCSVIFNRDAMKGVLFENKDKITDIQFSSEYIENVINCVDSAYTEGVFLRSKYIDIYDIYHKNNCF